MIIRKNIKSRIKSKAFRSLPERRSKRHLSFYSSIERDIRDIEMKLYRIKKALKYYSEDPEQEAVQIDPKKLDELISGTLDKAQEEFQYLPIESTKTKSNSKNIKHRSRFHYSSEKTKKLEKELYELLEPEFGDIPEPEEETYSSASSSSNVIELANQVYNKVGAIKRKITSFAEKAWYGASAVFTAASGVLMYLSHEDISKLGEIGNLDHALRNPEVIIKVLSIIGTIFGAIITFMVGKRYRIKAEQAFNDTVNYVKNQIKNATKRLFRNPTEENIQIFENQLLEIQKVIDANKEKDIALEDFKNMLYPKVEGLKEIK
ncbi:MAG: hypothetical protein QXF12_00115 [Candidatus Aenigmatarchaeota archaeon]